MSFDFVSLSFLIVSVYFTSYRTKEGFGNQCCYKNNGVLITRQTSGGSVVKVSVVGSSQFDYLTNLIRHQFEDVLPRIYCCIGKRASCDTYYKRRPSDDGSTYKIYTGEFYACKKLAFSIFDLYTMRFSEYLVVIKIEDMLIAELQTFQQFDLYSFFVSSFNW